MASPDPSRNDAMPEFWAGFRVGVPVFVASIPFALLFGALSVQNGFTVTEAVLMSASVFAGASQMVGLELFGKTIPPWVVVMSIFAVNFRHTLYSAALGRRVRHWTPLQKAVGFFFLTDPQYAESETRAERTGSIGFVWYLGVATPIHVFWLINTWLGAMFGQLISDARSLGLDFLLPIYFVGLVVSFRKRPLWLPVVLTSGTAAVVAERLVGSPWHVSIGALAGILLAAAMPPSREAVAAYDEPPPEQAGDSV